MKNCVICNTPFKAAAIARACSLKCKILDGIEKKSNGCWIYKRSSSGAYGKVRWKCKWYSAHRISYQVFNGPIPADKWVCHKCDIPKCVNPEHLFLGSASDNMKDASQKKRTYRGAYHHFAKFTQEQTEEMRRLKEEGFTYNRLQRIFNCSIAHLYAIVKEKIRKE